MILNTLILAITPFIAAASGPPMPEAADLRALAEIDGDLATFTDEEIAKYSVLAQVLGICTSVENAKAPPAS